MSLGLQLGPRSPKGQGAVLAWDIFCSESPKQQEHTDPDDEDEASRSNSWVLKMCQLFSMWPILQATPSKKEEKEYVLFSSSLRISSIRWSGKLAGWSIKVWMSHPRERYKTWSAFRVRTRMAQDLGRLSPKENWMNKGSGWLIWPQTGHFPNLPAGKNYQWPLLNSQFTRPLSWKSGVTIQGECPESLTSVKLGKHLVT